MLQVDGLWEARPISLLEVDGLYPRISQTTYSLVSNQILFYNFLKERLHKYSSLLILKGRFKLIFFFYLLKERLRDLVG